MGLLLKIILFGVAVYAAWKTFHRWKGLFDRFVGKPDEPVRPAPPPPPGRGHRGHRPVPRLRCLYSRQCRKMRPMRPSPATRPHSDLSLVGVLDRGGVGTYFAAPQKRP
jgi:hypothetical protein